MAPTQRAQQISSSSRAQNLVSVTTAKGTLVTHIEIDDAQRSGEVGVVLTPNSSDQTKLDILWTSDGATEAVDPANLRTNAVDAQLASNAAQNISLTQTQNSTTLSSLGPHHQYKSTFKSLISGKFPEDLICPLDSIDQERIERAFSNAHG